MHVVHVDPTLANMHQLFVVFYFKLARYSNAYILFKIVIIYDFY